MLEVEMTITERTSEDDQCSLSVARIGAAVVVTIRGDMDATTRELLSQVLDDLIDGQGNLFVSVEFTDIATVDVRTLDVFLQASERAAAHHARLMVTTPGGRWEPGF